MHLSWVPRISWETHFFLITHVDFLERSVPEQKWFQTNVRFTCQATSKQWWRHSCQRYRVWALILHVSATIILFATFLSYILVVSLMQIWRFSMIVCIIAGMTVGSQGLGNGNKTWHLRRGVSTPLFEGKFDRSKAMHVLTHQSIQSYWLVCCPTKYLWMLLICVNDIFWFLVLSILHEPQYFVTMHFVVQMPNSNLYYVCNVNSHCKCAYNPLNPPACVDSPLIIARPGHILSHCSLPFDKAIRSLNEIAGNWFAIRCLNAAHFWPCSLHE